MGLITETDYQYYEGAQLFTIPATGANQEFTCTLDTVMLDENTEHPSNYVVKTGTSASNLSILNASDYSVSQNVLRVTSSLTSGHFLQISLIQQAKWDNYGGYEYITLNDIIDNFIVGYVGDDKLISRIKRTDILFHAKRGLQEFSYDTLKSVKAMEISVPPSLAFPIPPDYVNYVQLSWVDGLGVKHIIYPTTLTSSPTNVPIQDQSENPQYPGAADNALPTQDEWGNNLQAQQAKINKRWRAANDRNITGELDDQYTGVYDWNWWKMAYGQRYGLNPSTTQKNGWFNIDPRRGTINFSSDLTGKLVMINYISDGLAYDLDTKVPKMAEEAMYMHILHAILSTRFGVPEYTIRRFQKQRKAALRNAKIRLSDIKLEAFTQVMRGKSKWIKS